MKLKFSLSRSDGSIVDLVAQFDATVTVGELATHLGASAPAPSRPAYGRTKNLTLALLDRRTDPLPPTQLITDSELVSGTRLLLTRAGGAAGSSSPRRRPAARLRIVDGPGRGTEFPLLSGVAVIGREDDCEVVLSDPLVSRRHARINVSDSIEISDLGSANGVLVGGEVVTRATLRAHDQVTLGDTVLVATLTPGDRAVTGQTVFIRPPRVAPEYAGREFEAPSPPERPRPQRFPLTALLAPVLMGGLLYAVTRQLASLIFIALSPLMLVGSAIEGRLSARREFRDAVQLFQSDIGGLLAEMQQARVVEEDIRRVEHPSVDAVMRAARELGPLLWCRRADEKVFGQLRLGIGTARSRSTIKMPSRNRAPHQLVQQLEADLLPMAEVHNVPIVADLRSSAVGVAGPRDALLASARALVLQAVLLHSPAEFVTAGVFGTGPAADWEWMKWLPHSSSVHSPVAGRQLTTSPAHAAALVAELEDLVSRRAVGEADAGPVVLLVVEADAPVVHSRLVALAEAGPAQGVAVLWLASSVERLPAACRVFVEAGGASGGTVGYVADGTTVTPVVLESATAQSAETVARLLSPIEDAGAVVSDASDLPRSVAQLALLGPELVSQPEAVVERWIENSSLLSGPLAPTPPPRRPGTLRAVLGQSAEGPYVIDLRADGPHALVGGTTGAGKSELLQSWILSLAAAHSPQRVTFLLVDYKGGAAFSECVDLPHTIGLVTDLSPYMVRRALTSLSAELRHREQLLAEHSAKDLVELESHGVVDAPPSLIIVVDEFAALVKDVPEFVDGMVDVAQRGRSLGLHLVLATQRPAGVIKDNLRANTNLRVALRMADEGDSVDVLGSNVAAAFDASFPGRAVAKAGARPLVPFQTAYAGGWTSDVPEPPEVLVEELSLASPTTWMLRDEMVPMPKQRSQTDIKRLVRSIGAANDLAQLTAPRKVWQPVLPAVADLAGLPLSRRDSELTFGLGDDPERQQQLPVVFRPDREGNLAVFGTGGSGKSTLLRTLAVAAGFSAAATPCHVYGLDFGSRGLAMLEPLPHVGSVVVGSDTERVVRLITWLRQVVDERAARYSEVRASSITEYRRLTGQSHEPRILLLIDGVAAFRQAYETTDRMRHLDMVTSIASEGRPVGVHLALSSDQRGGIPTGLAASVQRRLVMRMASVDDYSLLGVPADVLTLRSTAGRALDDGQELQVAILGDRGDVVSQSAQVQELAQALRQAGTSEAPAIRTLPSLLTLSQLPERAPDGQVLLGMDSGSLGPVAVEPRSCFLVTGPPGSGRTTALHTLVAGALALPGSEVHYLGTKRSALGAHDEFASRSTTPDEIIATAQRLTSELPTRPPGSPSVVVVVESAGDFVGGPVDMALQALARVCIAEDHWLLVEGEISTVRTTIGFMSAVKSSRRGLVLQPDQDAGIVFNMTFPRVNRSDLPAGRGFLIGSGRAALTQVARVDPEEGSSAHRRLGTADIR